MATWRTTDGIVLTSQVSAGLMTGDVSTTGYYPDVLYQYRVGGQTYSNNRVTRVAVKSSSRQLVNRTLQKYPVGA